MFDYIETKARCCCTRIPYTQPTKHTPHTHTHVRSAQANLLRQALAVCIAIDLTFDSAVGLLVCGCVCVQRRIIILCIGASSLSSNERPIVIHSFLWIHDCRCRQTPIEHAIAMQQKANFLFNAVSLANMRK